MRTCLQSIVTLTVFSVISFVGGAALTLLTGRLFLSCPTDCIGSELVLMVVSISTAIFSAGKISMNLPFNRVDEKQKRKMKPLQDALSETITE